MKPCLSVFDFRAEKQTSRFQGRISWSSDKLISLKYLFPMHPFSTAPPPNVLREQRKGALGTNELSKMWQCHRLNSNCRVWL